MDRAQKVANSYHRHKVRPRGKQVVNSGNTKPPFGAASFQITAIGNFGCLSLVWGSNFNGPMIIWNFNPSLVYVATRTHARGILLCGCCTEICVMCQRLNFRRMGSRCSSSNTRILRASNRDDDVWIDPRSVENAMRYPASCTSVFTASLKFP